MKLKSIKLYDDFRGLKSGFKLEFLENYQNNEFEPYAIVGRNGSGKSNILELLGAIFYSLELRCLNFLPEIFEDETKIDIKNLPPNAYELEYFINSFHIIIKKEKNKYAVVSKDGEEINSTDELRAILPNYIIGYSSGENEILSLPFYKMRFIQFDEYLNYLTNDITYSSPEARLIYLDNIFSQAIFLANFIFIDENILQVFQKDIGIQSVKQFRIIIKQDYLVEMSDDYQRTNEDKEEIELTSGLYEKIENLKSCATLFYKDEKTSELILDFYLDDKVREAFKFYFVKALELFKFFQTLILLNLYKADEQLKEKIYESDSLYAKARIPILPWEERIFKFKDFWIKKDDSLILSKSLSDGEHQFLHTIGLALLYKDTNSLFLLDEPETHFNPAWRAKYISTLKKCFENSKKIPEILVTSHSPFIVSDSKPENVLIFEKDKYNNVICARPKFNTFGASINKITINIFEKTETIGDMAKSKLDEFKNRINKEKNIDKLITEIEHTLGDSVEKILLLREIFDMQKD